MTFIGIVCMSTVQKMYECISCMHTRKKQATVKFLKTVESKANCGMRVATEHTDVDPKECLLGQSWS